MGRLLALFVFTFVVGCSRDDVHKTKIQIQLPETGQKFAAQSPAEKVHASSVDWGLNDPSTFADLDCYAIFVSAPDLTAGSCVTSSNSEVFKMGFWAGPYPAGSKITVDVPAGTSRTLHLVGLNSASSVCSFADFSQLSSPFLIGSSAKLDLAPRTENQATITANFVASGKFHSCRGTNLEFGPTLSTVTPPPVATPSVSFSNTPSSTSNATALNVSVVGSNATQYRYKVGTGGSANCADLTGYSSPTALSTLITNSLTGFSDGPLTLCALGLNSSGDEQAVASASSYTWTKDSIIPTVGINTPGSTISSLNQASYVINGSCSENGQSVNITGAITVVASCSSNVWTTNVNWSSTPDGSPVLYANHSDVAGNAATQSSRTYTKDATAPTSGTLVISSGASTTFALSVTLAISATDATEMYLTNDPTCIADGVWEPYATLKTGWNLAAASGTQTVYARFRDATQNTSSCVSDSIIHQNPAQLSFTPGPTTYSYGQQVNGSSTPQTFTIENTGDVPATGMSGSGLASPFSFWGGSYPGTSGTCGASLVNGATCTIVVVFDPASTASYSDSILLNFNDGTGANVASLNIDGQAVSAAYLTLTDGPTYDFGTAPIPGTFTKLFTLSNAGGFIATGLTLTGLVSPFAVSSTNCGTWLAAGSTCNIEVSFNPSVEGFFNDTLEVPYNDGLGGQMVSRNIQGTGYAPVVSFALGEMHTCGKTQSGEGLCWGSNTFAQAGNGTTINPGYVATIASGGWNSLSTSIKNSCGINSSNQALCWGDNLFGQIGDGTTDNRLSPAILSGTWSQISLGIDFTCALNTANAAYCWGKNTYGQGGDGTTTNYISPTAVIGGNTFSKVSTGTSHTCGLSTGGAIYCWGRGNSGQLGQGTTSNSTSPISASLFTGTYVDIFAAQYNTCALSTSGTYRCVGSNAFGQIGDGSLTDRVATAFTSVASNWVKFATSGSHSCAIDTGNDLYCWGYNGYGQLGDGTTTDRSTPALIGTQWTHIFVGTNHTCGIKTDLSTWCWGRNNHKQLGDGTTTDSPDPIQIFP